MKAIRKIVQIDEELCNGCGQCILDCAEGAIALVDGKARVIADMYCDGLGACLGGCPTNALTIIEREADAFDEEAVEAHLAKAPKRALLNGEAPAAKPAPHACGCPGAAPLAMAGAVPANKHAVEQGGCPGSAPMSVAPSVCGCPNAAPQKLGTGRPAQPLNQLTTALPGQAQGQVPGQLPGQLPGMMHLRQPKGAMLVDIHAADANATWPVKLRLMPASAPLLNGADILLAADCTAFTAARFHGVLKDDRVCLIACPKFEDKEAIVSKLTDIFATANIRSCVTVRMEVPCCGGIAGYCEEALERSGKTIPLQHVKVTRQGGLVEG